MANPTVSASLDKATYVPGETMTLTINYGDTDTKSVRVTVYVEDSQGNESDPVTVTAVIDPLTKEVVDADRSWALVTDNGTVSVYQAVA